MRDVTPVPFGEIGPERLAIAIREPLRVGELPDRREMFGECGIAQPHQRVVVERTDRQELGHPFGEPQRQHRQGLTPLLQDVALKGVHQLVTEHVIRFREPRGERQHDAAAEMIR